MVIETLPVGLMKANCYLVSETEKAGAALVIDPGDDAETVLNALRGRTVIAYLLTHGHFDHTRALARLPEAPVCLHRGDETLYQDPQKNMGYLIQDDEIRPPVSRWIEKDEILRFEAFSLPVEALHTPGHSPGSVCYKIENALFTGDTLFWRGVGRTDLPGSDPMALHASLERLFALQEDFAVYPGHGKSTTLFAERNER